MIEHTTSPCSTSNFQTCPSQFLQKRGTSCLQPANQSSASSQGAAGALQTWGKSLVWFSWGGWKLQTWVGWTTVKSDVSITDQGNGLGDLRNFPTLSPNAISIFMFTAVLIGFQPLIHFTITNTSPTPSVSLMTYSPATTSSMEQVRFQFTPAVKKAHGHTSIPNRNHLPAADIPAEHLAHGYYRSVSRMSDSYEEQFSQMSDERLVLARWQCNKHTFESHFCQVPLLFTGQSPERIKMLPGGELSEGIKVWGWTSALMDLTEPQLRGCQ